MPSEKKARNIDELQDIFSRVSIGILTDYRGLTTAEMTDLRRKLRDAGIRYQVVKNSLAQFAAQRLGRDDLVGSFEGPVAIVLGYDEITQPARVLTDYIRASKSVLNIKGGFSDTGLLTAADIETLATIPSKEILIGKVMAGMQSPLFGLVNCLTGPLRGIIGVLQARIDQLEGE